MMNSRTTRRAFMGQLGVVAGMGALASRLPGFSIRPVEASAAPVVSIFMDMPWVDVTGRAEPYTPPRTTAVPARRTPGEDFGNYQYYMV